MKPYSFMVQKNDSLIATSSPLLLARTSAFFMNINTWQIKKKQGAASLDTAL